MFTEDCDLLEKHKEIINWDLYFQNQTSARIICEYGNLTTFNFIAHQKQMPFNVVFNNIDKIGENLVNLHTQNIELFYEYFSPKHAGNLTWFKTAENKNKYKFMSHVLRVIVNVPRQLVTKENVERRNQVVKFVRKQRHLVSLTT